MNAKTSDYKTGDIVEITVTTSKRTFRQLVKLTRDSILENETGIVITGYRVYLTHGCNSDLTHVYTAMHGNHRYVGR